jgi:hypothetical protein
MVAEEKSAEELAFDELAAVVREKDESGLSFSKYIERLEELADQAARKLEVARAHAETCTATKLRKPRCDRGKPRKRTGTTQELKGESPAAATPGPAGTVGQDLGPEA